MAAATVNLPAIAFSVGPMLNGWFRGQRTGSGTIMWTAREMMAKGELDYEGMIDLVASSAPSTGYCNTMGTATTMNSLAEALGMQLPGSAAIPAPYRDRAEMAWRVGKRAVEIVHEDLRPSDIMTKAAFINAIRVNSAIGGSTERADPPQRHRPAPRRRADDRGVAEVRRGDPAPRQPAARGRVSRRGLLPRRRRSGGLRAADREGADRRGRDDGLGQDRRRVLQRRRHHGREGHPPLRPTPRRRTPASGY